MYSGRNSALRNLRTEMLLQSETNKLTLVSFDHRIFRHLDRNETFQPPFACNLFLINIFRIVEVSISKQYCFLGAEYVIKGSFLTWRKIFLCKSEVIWGFFLYFLVASYLMAFSTIFLNTQLFQLFVCNFYRFIIFFIISLHSG